MRDLAEQRWRKEPFEISTAHHRLDKERLLEALSQTYWAGGLPNSLIWQSIEGAIPFGLFDERGHQIGFARVATDAARFAWLSDVYVDEAMRGHGLGAWLMECCLGHPELQTVRRWMLATDDAYAFYERFGFHRVAESKYMVRSAAGL